jgi:hypothetical protein
METKMKYLLFQIDYSHPKELGEEDFRIFHNRKNALNFITYVEDKIEKNTLDAEGFLVKDEYAIFIFEFNGEEEDGQSLVISKNKEAKNIQIELAAEQKQNAKKVSWGEAEKIVGVPYLFLKHIDSDYLISAFGIIVDEEI